MKLWILRPVEGLKGENNPWEPWYNKAFGFIVRAETEQQARKFANDNGGDETGEVRYTPYRTGGNPWLDPKFTVCTELLPEGDAGVIMGDFTTLDT